MDKKEMVIKTARKLFEEYGYKKVSMDELAKESGVTKKTIYTYFKDKDAMFKYFIDEELNHMKTLVEQAKNNNKKFINQLSEGIYEVLCYRRKSKLFCNIIRDFKYENSDKCTEFMNIYDNEIIKYIEFRINEEIANKTIKPCNSHLSAFIIYKVYLSVLFEYDQIIDEKKVTKEIISILNDGLLNKKEDD